MAATDRRTFLKYLAAAALAPAFSVQGFTMNVRALYDRELEYDAGEKAVQEYVLSVMGAVQDVYSRHFPLDINVSGVDLYDPDLGTVPMWYFWKAWGVGTQAMLYELDSERGENDAVIGFFSNEQLAGTGTTSAEKPACYVNVFRRSETVPRMAVHELGHVMGAAHSEDASSYMFEFVGKAGHFDPEAAAEISKYLRNMDRTGSFRDAESG